MNLPTTIYFKYGEIITKTVKAKDCFGYEYDKMIYKEQSYRQLTKDVVNYFRENNITEETLISYSDTCNDAYGSDCDGSPWFEKRGGINIVHW